MTAKKTDRNRQGFTLLEIMIVVFILGVIMMMSMGFFVESIKATYVSEQKNLINGDVRSLTAKLSEAAKEANFVVLYNSFEAADRNTEGSRLLNGTSGDFLVFGFQDEPDLSLPLSAPLPVTRLTGYYRSPEDPDNPESEGPVRFFDTDRDFTFAENDLPLLAPFNPLEPPTVEEILTELYPISTRNQNQEIVSLSEGLANNQLFYHLGNSTIMVNGKIIHGVEAKQVTDTYNFTISTRR